MRIILLAVLVLVCAVGTTNADAVYSTDTALSNIVAQTCDVDTLGQCIARITLFNYVWQSLLWTSVDIGGVEAQYKITTIADSAWYVLPDTIVRILHVSMITNDNETRSVKAIYPVYYEDVGGTVTRSMGVSAEDLPIGYNYWADTLQLMPVPSRDDDTLILKCFVEHPYTIGSGFGTIHLKPAYTEAAFYYACHLTLRAMGRDAEADKYYALYEKTRDRLRARYQRQFNQMPETP